MPRARLLPALLGAVALSGCSLLGPSEITLDARNDSDLVMTVQVIRGVGPDAGPYGPSHAVDPLQERTLELAVPDGDWAVFVNGQELLGSFDAGARRGRIPVTLVLPAEDDPAGAPYWEAPADWLDTGPP